MRLIYGITVSTEKEEVLNLIQFIKSHCYDQIVVQIDSTKGDDDLFSEIAKLTPTVYTYPFNNDFSEFKNELNINCENYGCDYIFQLDADEMISKTMVKNIKKILNDYINEFDLIYIPRINIVDGITTEHIIKWGWKIDEKNRINAPDMQGRIYKPNLRWVNKVHEKINCENKIAMMPFFDDYSILHIKNIKKQEEQNNFYKNINK